jgi:hypothetical protein
VSTHVEVLSTCCSFASGLPQTSSQKIQDDSTAASAVVFDKTTQAAVAFCAAQDSAAIQDALDHLVAILFRATRGLFLTERGRGRFDPTREFLEAWLVDELLLHRTAGTYRDAAEGGEFRYLARRGRFALIDELRRRDRSKDPLDGTVVRMDSPINTGEGDARSFHDLLGVDCHQEGVCPIGMKPSLELSALQQTLHQCRAEIAKKLDETSFDVLSTICGLFPDRLSLGEVTREIAKARAVSEQTARKLHHALVRKLVSLRGDPVVRELFEIIRSAGDPIHLSTGTWDAQSQGFTQN